MPEQPRHLGPLLAGGGPIVGDARDEGAGGRIARQQPDEREGDLALAQVAAHGLSERLGVAGEVEQVVHQLKRDAEVEPVLAQRLPLVRCRRAQAAANLGASGKQVRRLAPDDVEVLVLGDVDVAVLGELVQLAFNHPQRDVAQQPNQVERVFGEGQRHRLDVEEVAQQDRDVVAPLRVGRQTSPSHFRIVDDVVVDERRRVDELDHGRMENRALAGVAAQPGGHQQHRGAHALAAGTLDVAADAGDYIDARLQMLGVRVFDPLEIRADRLEQAQQVWRRAVD